MINLRRLAVIMKLKLCDYAFEMQKKELCRYIVKLGYQYFKTTRISYNAISVDFDGVFNNPFTKTIDELLFRYITYFSRQKIPIIFLSGRGTSLLEEVLENVRKYTSPSTYLIVTDNLYFVTYNGATIYDSNYSVIYTEKDVTNKLKKYFYEIVRDLLIGYEKHIERVKIKNNNIQIFVSDDTIRRIILTKIKGHTIHSRISLNIRETGKGIDVYPINMGKHIALKHLMNYLNKNSKEIRNVLRIADQGHEHGTDFEFLNTIGGFTTDKVSHCPYGCFPVVSSNGLVLKFNEATKYIFKHIKVTEKGTFQLLIR